MLRLSEFIKLTVPEYIPVGILAALAGFAYAAGAFPLNLNLLYLLISIISLISGYNAFNCITDKYIDKINKPHRPLAKGSITETEALAA